jgi:hypothetical protein
VDAKQNLKEINIMYQAPTTFAAKLLLKAIEIVEKHLNTP